jgi:DNA topoisomerase-3
MRKGVFEKEDGEILANKVKESEFEIVLSKKNGNEFAPKLFDLTGLQVYCNTKFGFKMKRLKLYRLCTNKKWSPTQSRYHILPNDIYPKVPGF